jgi:hypothetical protein
MKRPPAPESFLPLKPHWFHVLLSLSGEPGHGYGIMQEVLDRTAGKSGFGQLPYTARSSGWAMRN